MAGWSGLALGANAATVTAAAGAVVVVGAGVAWQVVTGRAPDRAPDTPAALVSEMPDAAGTEPGLPAIDPPRFDVVRVEPDGTAVIAGRAEPGSTLRLRLDGVEIAEASADGTGGFVAVLDLAASDSPRLLSLEMTTETGLVLAAQDTIILSPTGQAELVAEGQSPEQAPAVLLSDGRGVRVLQPAGDAPQAQEQVALDTIAYDDAGEVVLSGRGAAEGDLRVYLDNEPVQVARIGQAGDWRADLPSVDPGTYTLRVDQVDETGAVLSRVETPFQREEPTALAAMSQGADGVEVVTVQPGFTLWGIAEQVMGEGTLYVQVYEANRDLIRDPDLIYPGQVFNLPVLTE